MNNQAKILIVDDEEMIRESLKDILEDEGYPVHTAESAKKAKETLKQQNYDLILLDIWMPDTDGITLLNEWQQENAINSAIIMMSGHGTIEMAVEATKLGAYYFLEKPLSTSKLLLTITRALETQQLLQQNKLLKAQLNPQIEIIGKSQEMQTLKNKALELAHKNTPILLTGKAGTGKQHLARYIHQQSAPEGKFISTQGIEEQQLQNLLLGTSPNKGLLQQAQNGTLYLSEISQLNPESQNLLTRLIREHNYINPQGEQTPFNARLILASQQQNHILKEQLSSELYDLITVAHLELPSLKEHNNDIPELLEYFSRQLADFEDLPYRHFSLAAQNHLRQYPWRNNIRELKNFVQRLLIQNDSAEIDLEEAKASLTPEKHNINHSDLSQIIPLNLGLREAREAFEHQYLREQFRIAGGNIAKLAERVGMDRTNLYRKLRSLNIDPTEKP